MEYIISLKNSEVIEIATNDEKLLENKMKRIEKELRKEGREEKKMILQFIEKGKIDFKERPSSLSEKNASTQNVLYEEINEILQKTNFVYLSKYLYGKEIVIKREELPYLISELEKLKEKLKPIIIEGINNSPATEEGKKKFISTFLSNPISYCEDHQGYSYGACIGTIVWSLSELGKFALEKSLDVVRADVLCPTRPKHSYAQCYMVIDYQAINKAILNKDFAFFERKIEEKIKKELEFWKKEYQKSIDRDKGYSYAMLLLSLTKKFKQEFLCEFPREVLFSAMIHYLKLTELGKTYGDMYKNLGYIIHIKNENVIELKNRFLSLMNRLKNANDFEKVVREHGGKDSWEDTKEETKYIIELFMPIIDHAILNKQDIAIVGTE